jgi:hypothetical protein
MSDRSAGAARWNRWAWGFCLLMLVIGAPAVGMASHTGRTAARIHPTSDQADALRNAFADPSGRFHTAVEREIQKQAARRAWLRTPGARQARRRSRHSFVRLGRREARLLAWQQFRSHLKPLPPHLLRPPHGGKVVGYVSDHAARVRTASGKRELAISTLPLRARTAAGSTAPVNLGLRGVGSTFGPANPIVHLRIPRQL